MPILFRIIFLSEASCFVPPAFSIISETLSTPVAATLAGFLIEPLTVTLNSLSSESAT